MIALSILSAIAIGFFISHVFLLFTSFGKKGFQRQRYFMSHLTLWIFGAIVFLVALLFAGKGMSSLVDIFNTPMKQGLILVIVAGLSAVAHSIVKFMVLPNMAK
ncbi:MAG: hypothetical protein QM731_06195 [Chitinophagaceae bacterium]